jgi:hypothetical protein
LKLAMRLRFAAGKPRVHRCNSLDLMRFIPVAVDGDPPALASRTRVRGF